LASLLLRLSVLLAYAAVAIVVCKWK